MAGGKASPRQKMINMMYLVLTALLAMNVSAEILDSFQQLADALRVSAETFSDKNHQLAQDIESTIRKDPANKRSEYLIPLTQDLNKKTDDLVAAIDAMRDKLISEEIGGGVHEGTKYDIMNKSETERNLRFFMMDASGSGEETDNNGAGSGKAHELHQLLDAYVDYANKLYSRLMEQRDSASNAVRPGPLDHFRTLAVEPKNYFPDIPEFAEKRQKTWEQFNFTHNPVVANMAVLEKLKNDVNVIETELLGVLRSKISNIVFKIDSLIPMSAPDAQVVVAGMQFKTKLFVTVSSTQMKPSFGGGVKVLPGGQMGELTIPANASVIPQGQQQGEQSYATVIRVPKADGTILNLNVRGTFIVRKPELVVTSRSVQILYMNCANNLNIDCPALGDLYNPQFTCRGGQTETNPRDRKLVRVIPSSEQVRLTVRTNTNGQTVELGSLDYRVIAPPKPTLMFSLDGSSQLNNGANIPRGAGIRFKVKADKDFLAGLPQDAKYVVNGVAIYVKMGIGQPTPLGTIQLGSDGGNIPLASRLGDASAGSQVICVVDEVRRINFRGQQFKEPFTERERTINLTLR